MSGQHVVGLKAYFAVITALMVLTAITVWAAFNDFGAANNVVALGIAVVKAVIVAAIFMHLKYAAKINWLFAVSGIVFMFILIAFVVGDIAGRKWQHQAEAWEAAPPVATAAPHH